MKSDIISIHCPLNKSTKHLINKKTLKEVKKNAIIVNTSRGEIINSKDILNAIRADKIGGLAIDAYEYEKELFFCDYRDIKIKDDLFLVLKSMPNVIITCHQGWFTYDALKDIANTTLQNALDIYNNNNCKNILKHDF